MTNNHPTSQLKRLQLAALEFRDERNWAQWHHPKALGIGLFVEAGELAEHFQYHRDHELSDQLQANLAGVTEELCDVLYWLCIISHEAGIDLEQAFLHKMRKNRKPNESKGYISVDMDVPSTLESLAEMTELVQELRNKRGWHNQLDPRDLLYKLIEEIGEVAEHFQWAHDEELTAHLLEHQEDLADELADCLICVLLMVHTLQVQLEPAFMDKLAKNRLKYPV